MWKCYIIRTLLSKHVEQNLQLISMNCKIVKMRNGRKWIKKKAQRKSGGWKYVGLAYLKSFYPLKFGWDLRNKVK